MSFAWFASTAAAISQASSAAFATAARAPQIAQDDDAPLTNDLLCNFVDRRKHPADPAWRGLVWHGAVGDREMRLFGEVGALDLKLEVFHPGRRATIEWGVDQRL